jgi:solute carrier family 6 GABA transporter-like protein 1
MVMQFLTKVGRWVAPPAEKSDDGRDQWPSRAAFLLAAMGGCAGQGTLIPENAVVLSAMKL